MKNNNLYIKTVAIFSVFLCIFTVVMLAAMIIQGTFFPREPEAEYESLPTFELTELEEKMRTASKRFTPDGDLLFIDDDRVNGLPKYREIYDKDYNLLWKGGIEETPSKYTTLEGQRENLYSDSGYRQNLQILTPDMKRNIIIFNKKTTGRVEYWRYVDGYFEGFENKQIIGYFAANGFTENKSEIVRFENLDCLFAYSDSTEGDAPILLCQNDDKLYLININKRQLEPLCEDIGKASISVHNWFNKDIHNEYVGTILIKRPDKKPVVIFRSNFKAVEVNGINIDTHRYTLSIASSEQITPEPQYKNYLIVRYYKDHPGKLASAQESKQWSDNFGKTKHTEVYRLYGLSDNGDAKLISDNDVVLIPNDTIVSNQAEIDSFHHKKGFFLDFSPVAFSYLSKMDFIKKANPNSKVIREAIGTVRDFQPYHKSIAWILGCVCAAGVFVHNRNRTQSKAALAGWMVFALLFNVAGLLTCLALTHYDLIKCDNCGKKRHLLTENCLHCGKPMPSHLPQASDIMG